MLVAANLRPAVVSVAPLIGDITRDTGFSNAGAGLLTTLPVLLFGLAAPLGPRLATRYGMEKTIFACSAVLVVATILRCLPGVGTLFLGSALIGAAIGVHNVVLPSLIKRDFAHRSGLMTGLYSMTLSGGAAVAAGLVAPINDHFDGNWRLTLGTCAVPAVLALLVWIPQLRRVHLETTVAAVSSVWRNRIAWAITVFMGTQSMIFFTFSAWLPQYLIAHGSSAAEAGTVLATGQVVALTASLVIPVVAGRYRGQRAITLLSIAVCAVGFLGLVCTDRFPALWAILIMYWPGAAIGLSLLFMVLRSPTATVTTQVSGMSQSIGYTVAAMGPIAIGGLHDVTGSWKIAMAALAVLLIPQALSTLVAARDGKIAAEQHRSETSHCSDDVAR
ncbi:CynX/NimT family MFS transporter [Nocardia callitridis]